MQAFLLAVKTYLSNNKSYVAIACGLAFLMLGKSAGLITETQASDIMAVLVAAIVMLIKKSMDDNKAETKKHIDDARQNLTEDADNRADHINAVSAATTVAALETLQPQAPKEHIEARVNARVLSMAPKKAVVRKDS